MIKLANRFLISTLNKLPDRKKNKLSDKPHSRNDSPHTNENSSVVNCELRLSSMRAIWQNFAYNSHSSHYLDVSISLTEPHLLIC